MMQRCLGVLIQQPEVDPSKITLIGHSEGTLIAPRIVIDQENKTHATTIKNIVLMASVSFRMSWIYSTISW